MIKYVNNKSLLIDTMQKENAIDEPGYSFLVKKLMCNRQPIKHLVFETIINNHTNRCH